MGTDVCVIGSGIIGLSTALCFLEQGFRVCVLSSPSPSIPYTSDKAAAIWSPYQINPPEKALLWSLRTYQVLEAESLRPDSCVQMVDLLKLENPGTPFWTAAVPPAAFRLALQEELPPGYDLGYCVRVPFMDAPRYLSELKARGIAKGIEFIEKTLKTPEEALDYATFAVNCSGLGAKTLCQDPEVYAIQGHIALVENTGNLPYMDDCVGELTYIFPRTDTCVLGGTALPGEESTEVKTEEIEALLKRCKQLVPGLQAARLLKSYVGLRPGRSRVRLEEDPGLPLIHNYGHGGAGFTVAWGCAGEVFDLYNQHC